MKEQLISFETAKLAKDKGFIHMKANCYGDNMCYQLPEGELINALKGNTVTGYILAPTQSLLQKWLREEHDIGIVITPSLHAKEYIVSKERVMIYTARIGEWNNIVNADFKYGIIPVHYHEEANTYEEALEKGLQEALKLI